MVLPLSTFEGAKKKKLSQHFWLCIFLDLFSSSHQPFFLFDTLKLGRLNEKSGIEIKRFKSALYNVAPFTK